MHRPKKQKNSGKISTKLFTILSLYNRREFFFLCLSFWQVKIIQKPKNKKTLGCPLSFHKE